MRCPIDESPLSVSSREGVEIDFCPQCRGVWLDRGELDKIIDRAANAMAAVPAPAGRPNERDDDRSAARRGDDRRDDDRRYDDDRRDDDDRRFDDGRGGGRRRKKNFLDDLFDFG